MTLPEKSLQDHDVRIFWPFVGCSWTSLLSSNDRSQACYVLSLSFQVFSAYLPCSALCRKFSRLREEVEFSAFLITTPLRCSLPLTWLVTRYFWVTAVYLKEMGNCGSTPNSPIFRFPSIKMVCRQIFTGQLWQTQNNTDNLPT